MRPVSSSGWGRWRMFADRLATRPDQWEIAGTFDSEHQAKNLYCHLHAYYGLRASVRRTSETSWETWAASPEGAV